MAELVFDLASKLTERLGSLAYEEICLAWGVKTDLQKLERTMSSIKSALMDAEEKQMHNKGLRSWLQQLKEVFSDAEDVLDEFECEALKRQVVKTYYSTGRKCDVVTSFLQYNGCVASSILQNGYRMRHEAQSFLTHGESQTFEWLKDVDPYFPLWPSTNCPQQKQHTNDCGVAVMYYMSSILKEHPMICQFQVNALKEMRGKILSKFLNNEKCWNEDNMEYLHN